MDYFCCCVRRLSIIGKLHAVKDFLNIFIYRQGLVNQIVYYLIFRIQIQGCDIPISIKEIIENTVGRDSKEGGLLILQLLQVRVFDGVHELVLDRFIHCALIILDSPYFFMLKLDFVSVGCV